MGLSMSQRIKFCQCIALTSKCPVEMASAHAMRSALNTCSMIPDWAAMSWMRQQVMPMIMHMPSQSLGEADTGITVSALKDWSVEGAAYLKMRLTEWVRNEGKLGKFCYPRSDQGFASMHANLKKILKSSMTPQAAHMKRTVSFPLSHVQKLVLQQHAANDCGFFFNFYTDP